MIPNEDPLTDEEKAILKNAGWRFLNPNYIFIPDDYDGCMAYGIHRIRMALEDVKRRQQN